MAAMRLMPRAEWERRLRNEHSCKPATDQPYKPKSGEWWLNQWGFLFPVPCDREGKLRSDDWQEVLNNVTQGRPLDLDTP
jgi:hypothetical protein